MLIDMLFGQACLNSDAKLIFVRASVIFSRKTVYTNLLVFGFHFHFLTVVKVWLHVNSYKILQFTVN